VCLPKDAPWREQFVKELSEFPLAEHDDQLDAYVWAQAGFVRGQGFFKVPKDMALLGAAREQTDDDFAAELMSEIGYDQDGFTDNFDSDFKEYKKRQGW
ncbi:MAG: hypothetical protein WBF15_19455, partial [Candidatus Sulfotelmatobacter sp.]